MLLLAQVVGISLSGLIAIAVLVRSGLRARPAAMALAAALGGAFGATGYLLDPADPIAALPPLDLTLELALQGALQGLLDLVLLLLGLALILDLPFRQRRRADALAAGAGIGLGYGLVGCLAYLSDHGAWPPAALMAALTYAPIKLTLGVGLGGSLMPGSNPSRVLALRLAVVLLAVAYAGVLALTDEIGHWLLWLTPVVLALAWLGLAVLFWLAAALILSVQRAADPAPGHGVARRGVARPRLWLGLALLVLAASFLLWLVIMTLTDGGQVLPLLLMTLLAGPLLAGIVMLSTGLSLRRRDSV